jgi:branched-chain amino acid transport system ATP-binding protein
MGINVSFFEVKNIYKNFGGLQAISDVSLNVSRGEILGLIGPNGSGKTTLFNLITNFIPLSEGQVFWKGEEITGLRPDIIAKKGIVRTFQITRVFPHLSIYENVDIGHHLQKMNIGNNAERMISTSIESLLDFFKLRGRKEMRADGLTYGERKKLSVALALSCSPELLLLDEPAAGLNETETDEMAEILRGLKVKGFTQILVEHDMKFIMGLCDRIVCLNFGKTIAEGTPREIQTNEEVIRVYLGSEHAD